MYLVFKVCGAFLATESFGPNHFFFYIIEQLDIASLPATSVTLENDGFNYLGIVIRPNPFSIVKDIYRSVLAKTHNDLIKSSPLYM